MLKQFDLYVCCLFKLAITIVFCNVVFAKKVNEAGESYKKEYMSVNMNRYHVSEFIALLDPHAGSRIRKNNKMNLHSRLLLLSAFITMKNIITICNYSNFIFLRLDLHSKSLRQKSITEGLLTKRRNGIL